MRPAFWPDYYWPWTSLTDVHTKPRGMHEPLQYSEMMKLAISRGYQVRYHFLVFQLFISPISISLQYFGYDPETYWDPNAETNEDGTTGGGGQGQQQGGNGVTVGAIMGNNTGTPPPSNAVNKVGGKDPPKLPRPLIQINCVQVRCGARLNLAPLC